MADLPKSRGILAAAGARSKGPGSGRWRNEPHERKLASRPPLKWLPPGAGVRRAGSGGARPAVPSGGARQARSAFGGVRLGEAVRDPARRLSARAAARCRFTAPRLIYSEPEAPGCRSPVLEEHRRVQTGVQKCLCSVSHFGESLNTGNQRDTKDTRQLLLAKSGDDCELIRCSLPVRGASPISSCG